MKTFLLILLLSFSGCATSERWIQIERGLVKLNDIQEFYRYGGEEGCLLLWEDQRTKVIYTQFVKHEDCYLYHIGIVEPILIRR